MESRAALAGTVLPPHHRPPGRYRGRRVTDFGSCISLSFLSCWSSVLFLGMCGAGWRNSLTAKSRHGVRSLVTRGQEVSQLGRRRFGHPRGGRFGREDFMVGSVTPLTFTGITSESGWHLGSALNQSLGRFKQVTRGNFQGRFWLTGWSWTEVGAAAGGGSGVSAVTQPLDAAGASPGAVAGGRRDSGGRARLTPVSVCRTASSRACTRRVPPAGSSWWWA